MAGTPQGGLATQIVTAAKAVIAVPAGISGGYIGNPLSPGDQGLNGSEILYVDQVGPCATLAAGGTIFALQPGDTWSLIPGSTLPVYVNAASAGHKFTCVYW